MSIGPILTGRVPDALTSRRVNGHINRANVELARLQDQLGTGQAYLTASEDPQSAIRAIQYQARIERQGHFVENARTDRLFLSATDTALGAASDALATARGLAQQAIGDTTTAAEKEALAIEAETVARSLVATLNSTFGDRFLFGGEGTTEAPFEQVGEGVVRYRGDAGRIGSNLGSGLVVANNQSGIEAFGAVARFETGDADPALTLATPLAAIHRGVGHAPGRVEITLDDGTNTVARTVDLAGAKSLADVKLRLEDAFAADAITLSVTVAPLNPSGLTLTPSAGTVAVADPAGSNSATRLGIASPAAASIAGGDLDPVLTGDTPLASLAGGAGIDPAGLQIALGDETVVVDLTAAVTVQDALVEIRLAHPDLEARIADDGRGLELWSRLSGIDVAIGENGGTTATDLGLRTFTGDTRLDDLRGGVGIPEGPRRLDLTLSDGTAVAVDLSAAQTIDDVLAAVNAAAPGQLAASLNDFGNGITLEDQVLSTGDFEVAQSAFADFLGLTGVSPGTATGPAPHVGGDPHPQEAEGLPNLVFKLAAAIRDGDNAELARIATGLDAEADRLGAARARVGNDLRLLENVEDRLLDEEVTLRESLAEVFDADLAEVVSNIAAAQAGLEATLTVAGQTLRLSLINFL